jgi:Amt family ammonium transporter
MCGWALAEITWSGEKWFAGHPTAGGCATGVVVGLVAITPACGYVGQMASIAIGLIATTCCYWAVRAARYSPVHDQLECLPCHGVAGMVGTLCTGLFASVGEDSPVDGAFYGNPVLLGKQATAVCVGLLFDVIGTSIAFFLVALLGRIFNLPVRVPSSLEENVDGGIYGEAGYEIDSINAAKKPRNSMEDLTRFLGFSQSRARGSQSDKLSAVQ